MAITFVSAAAATGSSTSLPTFAAGDLALVFAYRDGSNTPPLLPSGWTDIKSSGTNSNASRVGRRVLQSGDTTTGTWTNATELQVMVLRGQDATTPMGNDNLGGASSNQISYSAISPLAVTDGTSWVVGFAGHRTATDVNAKAVTGMTTRSGSVTSLGMHTAEGVSTFAASNYTTTVNASSGWRSYAVEVRASTAIKQTGTAQISLAAGDTPATRTQHAINVRARKTSSLSGTIRAQLFEVGSSRSAVLETPELSTSLANYALAIADADAATISSYANLEIRFFGYSGVGDATVFEIAQVSLSAPASTSKVGAVAFSSTATMAVAGIVSTGGSKQTGIAEISFAPASLPATRTSHSILVRARKTNGAHTGQIRIQLYEGATARSAVITGPELTTSLAAYQLPIADADAATISSYSNLAVRLWGYSSTGTATVFEVAEVDLQLPVAAPAVPGAPIYPGASVFPQTLVHFSAAASAQVTAGGVAIFGATLFASTASLIVNGNAPPTSKTGQAALNSTATMAVNGTHEATGQVLLASTATMTVGSVAVQDVVGAAVFSATATMTVAGTVPGAALPANFVALPLGQPDMLVAIAFASQPLSLTQTYTGVGAFLRGIGAKRGRQFELDRIQAGTSDFVLSNRDGRFNPTNSASPYYPNLKPTKSFKWQLRWNGVIYDVYTGFLQGYPQEYPNFGFDRVVRQSATDLFLALSLAKLIPGTTTLAADITTTPTVETSEQITVASTDLPMPQSPPFEIKINDEKMTVTQIVDGDTYQVTRTIGEKHAIGNTVTTDSVSFGQEYSGARVRNVLEHVGFTSNLDIDQGQSLLAASDDLAGSAPLEHLQLVAEAENGRFFIAKNGVITFRERHWFFKNELTARATFGDLGGNELPYAEAKVTYEEEKIWNIVRITPASGNTQEARDQASIDDHFERPLEKTWPLADDNEALAAAQYFVQRYSRMQERIPEIRLLGRASPSIMWPQLLALELGQRFNFKMRPKDGSAMVDKDLVVEAINIQQSTDNIQHTLEMSLADPIKYWRLGITGASELGSTTILAY